MSEWQPIETVPKDGTNVLLWTDLEAGLPVVAQWREPHPFDSGGEYGPFVWIEPSGSKIAERVPTHWMPLPEPPENPENDADLPTAEDVRGILKP